MTDWLLFDFLLALLAFAGLLRWWLERETKGIFKCDISDAHQSQRRKGVW